MTDKEKILKKIHDEMDELMDAQGNFEYPEHEGAYHALCNLEAYIDSMPEEPASDDLEEAAIEYCGGNTGADARVRAGFVMGGNWQREQIIDKACEWLYQQQLVVDNMEKFIEDFRKAME